MKIHFLLPLIGFVATVAQAQVLTPQPIRTTGLGLSSNVVSRLEQTAHAMKDSFDDSYCTAFPVTRDGYLLTAMHCVRNCLVPQNVMELGSNSYLGLLDLVVNTKSNDTATACPNLTIPTLGVAAGGVQVVATGSALMLFNERFFANSNGLYEEMKARGWANKANDFALLKIQPHSQLRCLRLESSATVAGQNLWSVGYPLPKDPNAQPVLSASFGILYATPEQSQDYTAQKSERAKAMVKEMFSGTGTLFSSAANTFGQSGGPVIAQNGNVIGITSGFSTPPNQPDAHELVASSIVSVLQNLPTATAQMLVDKNQACQ